MGILDQIANPQMLNMQQTLDIRQKRIESDEAKRREIKMGQLIAEAVPNLKPGSKLHQMALEDPRGYMLVAKSMGVPLNAGDQMQQIMNDTADLYMRAQSDPEEAYMRAVELKEQRNKLGIETPQMDRWIDLMENDPQTGLTSLFVFHRAMNPEGEEKPAGLVEFEGMTQGLSQEEKDKARRIKLGLDPRAQGSSDLTIAEGGLTDIVAGSKKQISGAVEGGKQTAKGNVTRSQDFINRGVAAAEGLPGVNRGIQLLETVETGGFDQAKIIAKQKFGIESADEGELTYNLGKSVLTQLRETFGSAFTENEGQRLADLEAGLSRSPATNKRILSQVKQIMEAKAKRGKEVAIEQGDDFTAQDIDKFMQMDLSPIGGSGEGANTPGITGSTTKKETAAERLRRLTGGQ